MLYLDEIAKEYNFDDCLCTFTHISIKFELTSKGVKREEIIIHNKVQFCVHMQVQLKKDHESEMSYNHRKIKDQRQHKLSTDHHRRWSPSDS